MTETELHGPAKPRDPDCLTCELDEHACTCGQWLHHGTRKCGRCKALADGGGY